MDWLQTTVLALVQGLTEFLPVSSSAHLILFPKLLGWPDQGLAFDVAVHLGTLLAVCHYFRLEIVRLTAAWLDSIINRQLSREGTLAWGIVFATVPIVIAGLLFGDSVETLLRSPRVLGIASIVFGVLLWLADRFCSNRKSLEQLKISQAGWIGLVQVLAIIPGASRSGVTMTAARAMGFTREAAARFSFLLAIPTIFLAFLWQLGKIISGEAVTTSTGQIIVGVILSALIAWLSIHAFLAWVRKTDMTVFVLYRIVLGIVILFVFV